MKNAVKTIEVREAILDATDRLLARFGYQKMTIDDLAGEVGIGKGSVYLHFASKEEIVLSHIDRIVERLNRQLLAISRENAPARLRLRRMIVERVLFRFDAVQHYSKSLNELLAALRPKFLARRKLHFENEAAVFAAVVDDGIATGEFGAIDAAETAQALLLGTNALLPYSLSAAELGARDELERRAAQLADIFLNGLLSRRQIIDKEQ